MSEFINGLDKILTWSASAMTLAACFVVGYGLRFIPKFPNNGIPLAVILTGGIAFILMADPRGADTASRIYVTRHVIAGLSIGLVAWLAHKTILSRLEDWLSNRFDVVAKLLGNGTSTPPQDPPK